LQACGSLSSHVLSSFPPFALPVCVGVKVHKQEMKRGEKKKKEGKNRLRENPIVPRNSSSTCGPFPFALGEPTGEKEEKKKEEKTAARSRFFVLFRAASRKPSGTKKGKKKGKKKKKKAATPLIHSLATWHRTGTRKKRKRERKEGLPQQPPLAHHSYPPIFSPCGTLERRKGEGKRGKRKRKSPWMRPVSRSSFAC